MNDFLNNLNNENYDLSLSLNEELASNNPYGFNINHSDSLINNIFLDPISSISES